MSKICDCCGKTQMVANQVHRQSQWVQRRTSSPKQVNLQNTTIVDENGNAHRVKVCAKCLKKMKAEVA